MQNISGICSKPLTSLEWLPNDNFNHCQDLMVWWQSYYWTFDNGNGAAGLLVPTSLSPPLSTSSHSAPSLSPPVLCWPVRAWPPPFLTFQYFFITRFSNFSKYLGVFSPRFEIQTPEKAIRGGLYAIVHHHGKGRQGLVFLLGQAVSRQSPKITTVVSILIPKVNYVRFYALSVS